MSNEQAQPIGPERCPECGSERRGTPSCGCGWHDGSRQERTPEELAALESRLLANVVELLDLMGDWEDNTQVRKTGLSIHIKWEKPIDINDAARIKSMLLHGPEMLENVLTEMGKLRAAAAAGAPQ